MRYNFGKSFERNIGMENLMERITFDPQILRGKPVIRDMRISVEMILELLAKGSTQEEILEDYPVLEPQDIHAAWAYTQPLSQ